MCWERYLLALDLLPRCVHANRLRVAADGPGAGTSPPFHTQLPGPFSPLPNAACLPVPPQPPSHAEVTSGCKNRRVGTVSSRDIRSLWNWEEREQESQTMGVEGCSGGHV